MTAYHRVAMTHFREDQLRESFVELDFDNIGVIDLDELQMVVKYAGDQLRVKRGPSFKNVAKMFA